MLILDCYMEHRDIIVVDAVWVSTLEEIQEKSIEVFKTRIYAHYLSEYNKEKNVKY